MSCRKNLSSIPTWKIREILSSNHCTGKHGADYEPVKEELEAILWSRLETASEKENERNIKLFNMKGEN